MHCQCVGAKIDGHPSLFAPQFPTRANNHTPARIHADFVLNRAAPDNRAPPDASRKPSAAGLRPVSDGGAPHGGVDSRPTECGAHTTCIHAGNVDDKR
jgi:hypothetical protein